MLRAYFECGKKIMCGRLTYTLLAPNMWAPLLTPYLRPNVWAPLLAPIVPAIYALKKCRNGLIRRASLGLIIARV
jgi:hypothetical protein